MGVGEQGFGQCAEIATMTSEADDFVQRGTRFPELAEEPAESQRCKFSSQRVGRDDQIPLG